ncbi:hypothetical protein OG320_17185 [Microbispora sp. NBC_01189]|uniref:hypothetical protein n=1 Tax=Microbispora sp. NBC_01189 TaxID=2903583 RepID=UPI002E0D9AFE|nr:hypothetical protein OG320_17185 [Microbispora sp. NBC_01189]
MTHEHRSFDNPPVEEHDLASTVLEGVLHDATLEGEAADVLVGLALHDADPAFVEGWCMKLGRQLAPGSPLLGLVGLCVGHLARRFGHVGDEAASLVVDLANRSKADPSDVDARAQDGLDDVVLFSGRTV